MVPAVVNDDYIIRFAVCSVDTSDDDIFYAWNVVTETTSSFDLYRPDQLVCPANCNTYILAHVDTLNTVRCFD